jgi:serine phosphatase RsbU (regulator of sigma subunit)
LIGYAIHQSKLFDALNESIADIKLKNEIIHEDLTLAKRIQMNMLPQRLPEIKGVKISTRYLPMFEVGGDYFDFNFIEKENCMDFALILTDASGHGVSAAFITTMLKIAFSSDQALQLIASPIEVLKLINKTIIDKTAGNFVTAFYVFFDIEKMKAKLTCAGHNPAYKISCKTGKLEEIHPRGRILGFIDEIDFVEHEINICSGDRFFFYTDGLTEAIDEAGEEFEKKLIEILTSNYSLDAESLCDIIIDKLKEHALYSDKQHFDDDIAIIIVDIRLNE